MLRDEYEDATRRIMTGDRVQMNQLSEEVIRLQRESKQLRSEKRTADLEKRLSEAQMKNKLLESQL